MYRQMDELDLRNEIVLLKKQNLSVKEENNLLKVKVRRLQTQLDKRDKQMDAVLAPAKTQNYRKFINEKSATLIIKMKDQIENLEILCQEKDVAIKRLQDQLQTARIYSQNHKNDRRYARREKNFFNVFSGILSNRSEKDEDTSKNISLTEDCSEADARPSSSWTPAVKTCCSAFEILLGKELSTTEECPELPENDDKTDNNKNNDNRNKNDSPESDLERGELYDSTHEEIQTLQSLFMDMVIEVNSLKTTVGKLKAENENRKQTIKEKDCSIEELMRKLNMFKIYAQKISAKPSKNFSSRSCNMLSLEKIYKTKSAANF